MPIKQSLYSFMKACVIHHDHALGFKVWNEGIFAPAVKYIPIDVLLKVIQGKQHLFIQSTNDVGALFTLPVIAVYARGSNRCIAIGANGLGLKATLIHVYNCIALSHIIIQVIEVISSFYRTGFWML